MAALTSTPFVMPRFAGNDRTFYHLTTADGWRGIQQSGVLRATRENVIKHLKSPDLRRHYEGTELTGVFTVDGDNFTRHWMRERSPYPDGTVSSGDYHLRRFARRAAQQIAERHGKTIDALKMPWPEVCRFLSRYGSEPALAVLAIPQAGVERNNVLVRCHEHMYNDEPPPEDGNYDERFAQLLDSTCPLSEWETGEERKGSWEFVLPHDVPVTDSGVRLEKMISAKELLALFEEDECGDKGKPDTEKVRRLFLNA